MSNRYKITMSYDGSYFFGFQRQPNKRTIEGSLTKAVNKMAKYPEEKIIVYGSGRTDARVHALYQVAHFDFPFDIAPNNMLKGMNSLLPLDIRINKVEIVPKTFHARYNVSGKSYIYRVDLSGFRDPFKRFYTGHWKYPINIQKIKIAAKDLIGEHDFTSFVASGSEAKTNVRTIYDAECHLNSNENELSFRFYGNGFLYNMVRIIVGVLLEIGSNKREIHDIIRLYKVKDRTQAIRTASPGGLYLQHVYYEGEDPKHPVKLPYRQR